MNTSEARPSLIGSMYHLKLPRAVGKRHLQSVTGGISFADGV